MWVLLALTAFQTCLSVLVKKILRNEKDWKELEIHTSSLTIIKDCTSNAPHPPPPLLVTKLSMPSFHNIIYSIFHLKALLSFVVPHVFSACVAKGKLTHGIQKQVTVVPSLVWKEESGFMHLCIFHDRNKQGGLDNGKVPSDAGVAGTVL